MDALTPRWDGTAGRFEIWFLTAFARASRQAFWLRHTLFAPAGGGRGRHTVWAAAFDPHAEPRRVAGKVFTELTGGSVSFPLEAAGCVLDGDRAEGALEGLAWSLRFARVAGAPTRLPHVPEAVPLPTRAWHLASEAPLSGTVRTPAGELRFDDARMTMMHLHGRRRVDDLLWIYAPFVDGEPDAAAELTWVRPRRPGPAVAGAFVRDGRGARLDTALGLLARATAEQPRPGLARMIVRTPGRLLVARAWAERDDLVGYVYRDPAGHDVHVAQSDIASVVVDVYRRRRLELIPESRLVRQRGSGLEVHQREPLPGVTYLGWDERALAAPPPPAATPPRRATSGDRVPLPEPRAILAFGLTYADHLRETGHDPRRPPAPVLFEKPARSWLPVGSAVDEPSSPVLLDAVAALDPGLADAVQRRFPRLPALLDYEGELALVVLEEIDDDRLRRPGPLPVGLTVANDLTARSVQVLGEGAADPLPFWAVSKSFAGFLPIGGELWQTPGGVGAGDDDRWPEIELTTRVNGEPRQRGTTRDLILGPRAMLRAARRALGRRLLRGDVLLTGTPAGVALQVSRWRRRLAGLLFDRVGRLAFAIRASVANPRFLGPGDEVTVDAGDAGSRTIRVEA